MSMTKEKLYGLDLFSGIGGNSLALGQWIDTVAYCEQDRYAQAVLMSRMQDGLLPRRPIWDDVRTLRGNMLPEIDIIIGGFPCQDISVAGRGAGLEGERSGLFFEIVRLAQETQCPLLFIENVPAIRTRGLDTVVRTLSGLGYDCRWGMLSAYDVGASHLRERWFLLAAHSERLQLRDESRRCSGSSRDGLAVPGDNGAQKSVADSLCEGFPRCVDKISAGTDRHHEWREPTDSSGWQPEPDVGRVVNGLPFRVDRIKCLGNAVVPAQAREAFKRLLGIDFS